jgi:transketolase
MPDQITPTPGTLERGRPLTDAELLHRADWIRLQTIDLIAQAGLGHYSSTFSAAELVSTLYYHALRLRPSEPNWPDRDRFVLGKGHVVPDPWPALADMAIAARLTGRDYRTFVLTGDGELQEGQVWEAAMAASHYKLGNLVAIVDANGFSGAGPTSDAINIEPLAKRFEAFGWTAREIDGHDAATLKRTFDELPAPESEQPVVIIARTRKGHGVDFMEKAPQAWHLGLLNEDQYKDVVAEITARMELANG